MPITIEAIYENGVLKPSLPLPLEEHETVRITIEPRISWAEGARLGAPVDGRF